MKHLIALAVTFTLLCFATAASADPTGDITITYRTANAQDVTTTIFAHDLLGSSVIPIDLNDHTTWLVYINPLDRDHGIPTGRPFWIHLTVGNPAIIVTQKDGNGIPLEIAEVDFRFEGDREIKFYESSSKGQLFVKFSNLAQ